MVRKPACTTILYSDITSGSKLSGTRQTHVGLCGTLAYHVKDRIQRGNVFFPEVNKCNYHSDLHYRLMLFCVRAVYVSSCFPICDFTVLGLITTSLLSLLLLFLIQHIYCKDGRSF